MLPAGTDESAQVRAMASVWLQGGTVSASVTVAETATVAPIFGDDGVAFTVPMTGALLPQALATKVAVPAALACPSESVTTTDTPYVPAKSAVKEGLAIPGSFSFAMLPAGAFVSVHA